MIAFLQAHWDAIVAVIAAGFVIVDKIVKLTPTAKDDAVAAQVEAVLKNLGILKDDPAAK